MEAADLKTETLAATPLLAAQLARIFGRPADSIADVARRAREVLPQHPVIVWEGDPETFQFTYVSESAEQVLGYPAAAWREPGFWAQTVVHPEDQGDAVAYCALATAQGRDHDFQYRARARDGREVLLHDVVHVIKGTSGVATRLRGIMVPLESNGV